MKNERNSLYCDTRFVTISPHYELRAFRGAFYRYFLQCEITARSHGAGERACTHGGAFDRAESGVLRASLRKLVTLNLRYRSIGGPTDRPTRRVVKRRSDIWKRNEILPCEHFDSSGMHVCACVYEDFGIPSDFDSTNLVLLVFVAHHREIRNISMVKFVLPLR